MFLDCVEYLNVNKNVTRCMQQEKKIYVYKNKSVKKGYKLGDFLTQPVDLIQIRVGNPRIGKFREKCLFY